MIFIIFLIVKVLEGYEYKHGIISIENRKKGKDWSWLRWDLALNQSNKMKLRLKLLILEH